MSSRIKEDIPGMSLKGRWYRWTLYTLLAVFAALPLAACGDGGTQAQNPNPTPNPAYQRVPYDVGLPPEAKNAPKVGDLPGDTMLNLNITFKTDDKVLEQLGGDKAKDGEEIDLSKKANEIGITDQEYEQLKQFFGVDDAKLELGKLHTNLKMQAKAAAVASLLQTKFVYKELKGRKFFAPEKDPMVPKFVSDKIVAITGLESYSKAPKQSATFQPLTPKSTKVADCNVPSSKLLVPEQVKAAYGFDPRWTGKGTIIYLPEFELYDKAGVQNYLDCVGYKGKFSTIDVGQPPTEVGLEATLDIEMVAGLAPEADIVVYQTENSGYAMENVFQQIIEDAAKTNKQPQMLSLSWGLAETNASRSQARAIAQQIKLLSTTHHMSVFVASGDCGAFDGGVYGNLEVDFPASTPYALGVGGTQLTVDGKGQRMNEIVWGNPSPDKAECKNDWGSGGGVSTVFEQPSWQKGDGVQNKYSNGGRQLPDIAAVADMLAVYYEGQWGGIGGTSAAAPIWAAAFATVNQALVANTGYFFFGPRTFYAVADDNAYHDVVEGNNQYYEAAQGWDYGTGMGTPDLEKLYTALEKQAKS